MRKCREAARFGCVCRSRNQLENIERLESLGVGVAVEGLGTESVDFRNESAQGRHFAVREAPFRRVLLQTKGNAAVEQVKPESGGVAAAGDAVWAEQVHEAVVPRGSDNPCSLVL